MSAAKATRPTTLTGKDKLALAIATGLGAGYLPIAPGTWGSGEVTVGVFVLFFAGLTTFAGPVVAAVCIGLALALAWVGVWAGDRAAVVAGDDDPGLVVIDEVVGQLLTYSLLPLSGHVWTPTSLGVWLAAGFFLFRALDIVKPGPIDPLQKLHGGLGIMADDFLAGIVGGWLLFVAALVLR